MAERPTEAEELRALYHKARKELARLFALEHERGLEVSKQAERIAKATGLDLSRILDPSEKLSSAVDGALKRLRKVA